METNKEELANPQSKAVEDIMNRANATFKDASTVKHLVNDSEILLSISHAVQEQASKIGKAHAPITLASFKTALRTLYGETHVNWARLGRDLRVYSSSVPEFDVMLGPVDIVPPPKKEKEVKPKLAKVIHEQEKPQDLKSAAAAAAAKGGVDERADGFEMLKRIEAEVKQQMKKHTLVDADNYNKGQKAPMDMFELLVDPDSFAQTVENVFAYSFIVKDGWASLKLGADGMPKAASTQRPDSGVRETQAILAFTMDDWKRIVATYGIEKGLVKHRTAGYEDEKKPVQ